MAHIWQYPPGEPINTCLDEMEYSEGRDSICERLAYQKNGLQNLCSVFEGMYEKERECLNIKDFRF